MCPQNACNTNLHQVVQQDIGDSGSHEMMEMIGELDPQTGIYSIHQPAAATIATAGNMLYISVSEPLVRKLALVCGKFYQSGKLVVLPNCWGKDDTEKLVGDKKTTITLIIFNFCNFYYDTSLALHLCLKCDLLIWICVLFLW
jgi:hypothetical protein